MRAIYCVTRIPEWVEAARHLKEHHGWEPVYWFTNPEIHDHVAKAFPEAVTHRWHDAVRGVAAPGLADCTWYPLDGETLDTYLPCQSTVLRMMDRMDPDGSFQYGERMRHYHRILMYWLNVVERLKPDVVVFSSSPHLISDFVLYHVCASRGVHTLICTPTSFPHISFVRDSIDQLPPSLIEAYSATEREHLHEQALDPEIEDSMAALQRSYEEAEPAYMRQQRQSEMPGGQAERHLAWRLVLALGRPHKWHRYVRWLAESCRRRPTAQRSESVVPRTNYFKPKGVPPEVRALNSEELTAHAHHANTRRKSLKAYYQQLAVPVDLGEPFIYVPLHYQPERTTCPDAGAFVDQYLLVNLIAACRPNGWSVYVREHPSQFRMMGEKGRTQDLYDDLVATPGVKLVPTDESPFDLIDKARAVATATGTAGWEALVRGKPVFVFGNAWYRACHGAFSIRSTQDMRRAIAATVAGDHPDRADVRAYSHAVMTIATRFDVNGLGNDLDAPTRRQHALTISEALLGGLPPRARRLS